MFIVIVATLMPEDHIACTCMLVHIATCTCIIHVVCVHELLEVDLGTCTCMYKIIIVIHMFSFSLSYRAFAVVASALGIPSLLPFLKAVCHSKKSWQARHTGREIVHMFCHMYMYMSSNAMECPLFSKNVPRLLRTFLHCPYIPVPPVCNLRHTQTILG